MKRKKKLCVDCKADIVKLSEHYFVNNHVWNQVMDSERGFICIGCLEKRLKRELNMNDFTSCHINNPKLYSMSNRLVSRLKNKPV
jgi:hypothetical protein